MILRFSHCNFYRFNKLAHAMTLKKLKYTTSFDTEKFQISGDTILPISSKLNLVDTRLLDKWPVFRIINPSGNVVDGAESFMNMADKEFSRKIYGMLVRIQVLDEIFYNAQRQGRISFYLQCTGEEGIHIGSAAAVTLEDVCLAQYREVGILLWRGFTLQQIADQCFSNEADPGKGRQMPIHYGSKELKYHFISSPLATQLPHAVGVAFALKAAKKEAVTICYFGEGAASEGDFHASLNFAATLDAPVIFFCRNNGYAISTSTTEQYRGDGIVSRAVGYGIHAIRVDGNDVLAVYAATKEARKIAVEKNCPVLIEAMSYRRGHHSTSDDSTRYRSLSEINYWQENFDPVTRFRKFLISKNWWNDEEEQILRDAEKLAVLNALNAAEKKPKPGVETLFDDVYETKPQHLMKQENELMQHVRKYPEYYNNVNQ